MALAGGVALARVGQRRGLRQGYGASIAAMLQTVAIMGPARFGVPLTQALTAPLLGRLEARGATALRQIFTCAAIRLAHTGATMAFFILVLAGGIGEYNDFYDAIAGFLPLLPEGSEAALFSLVGGLLAWAAFASTVQVLVYRRGLHMWAESPPSPRAAASEPEGAPSTRRRFDPRAIVLAAAVAFALLLSSTSWALLGAVSAWLAVAWALSRGDGEVVPAGLVIAATLAGGVFVFALVGGGVGIALRRAARAGLLVLVATWLRSAAGADGLREVSGRALRRLRRLPALPEAASVLQQLGSGRQLGDAARSLVDRLRGVPMRPVPVLDAVLKWVAAEAARFRPVPPAPPARLRLRAGDALLLATAVAPAIALVAA